MNKHYDSSSPLVRFGQWGKLQWVQEVNDLQDSTLCTCSSMSLLITLNSRQLIILSQNQTNKKNNNSYNILLWLNY